MKTRQTIYIFVAIVLFVLIIVSIITVNNSLTEIRESEFNLYASQAAIESIKDYVYKKGEWPSTLNELKEFGRFQGALSWPEDADEVCSRIHIEFGVSPFNMHYNDIILT